MNSHLPIVDLRALSDRSAWTAFAQAWEALYRADLSSSFRGINESWITPLLACSPSRVRANWPAHLAAQLEQ